MIKRTNTFATTNDISLKNTEIPLYDMFLSEYNDLFEEIFLLTEKQFLNKLTENVKLKLGDEMNSFSKISLAKVMSTIKGNKYISDLRDMKKIREIMTSLGKADTSNVVSRLQIENIIPHCAKTSKPYHVCGSELIRPQATQNDYALCLQCKTVYKPELVHLKCKECHMEYYSPIVEEDFVEPNNKPATWEVYHCRAVFDATIPCPKCRDVLYYNNVRNLVRCKTCGFSSDPMKMDFQCVLCKEIFHSNAIPYSEYVYKPMEMCIKRALNDKVPARPSCNPCCGADPRLLIYKHKKDCKGKLYLGILNGNKIAVCEFCKVPVYFQQIVWTCPECGTKFKKENRSERKDEEEKNSTQSHFHKESSTKDISDDFVPKKMINGGFETAGKMTRGSLGFSSNTPVLLERFTGRGSMGNFSSTGYNKNMVAKKAVISNFSLTESIDSSDLTRTQTISGKEPFRSSNCLQKFPARNSVVLPGQKNRNINLMDINLMNISSSKTLRHISKPKVDPPETFVIEDFVIGNFLGEGAFGKIYQATYIKNDVMYALKKIKAKSAEEVEILKREYQLHMGYLKKNKGKDTGVVKVYGVQQGVGESQIYLYVLMELASTDWEVEIKKRSKTKSYYNEGELRYILKRMVHTMADLELSGITHRDIKLQNILIVNGDYKICDFGEAKVAKEGQCDSEVRGTELYMSPILFNSLKKGVRRVKHDCFKSDVFSLGFCLIIAAALNYKAAYDIRELNDMENIKNILVRYLIARYSSEFVELLLKMVEIEESKRPSFIELDKMIKEQ